MFLQPLPHDRHIYVHLDSGVPSTEGPLLSEEKYSFSFQTVSKLEISRFSPSKSGHAYRKGTVCAVFNYPLKGFDAGSMIKVEPECPGLVIDVSIYNISQIFYSHSVLTIFFFFFLSIAPRLQYSIHRHYC
jgi:hypothetical protein